MTLDPHPINRKILRSVRNNLDRIKCGHFEERDVKELLVDLREFTRHNVMKNLPKEIDKFHKPIQDFLEICDFMAHSYREKGIIEKNVRNYAKKLHESLLASRTADGSQSVPLVEEFINAKNVAMALLALAYWVLSAGDKSITCEYVLDAFKHCDDIALCLMSLLQDSIIELDNKKEGYAILYILPFEGRYRLYCRVIGSRIDLDARERGARKVILQWPVIESSSPCIDDLPSHPLQGLPHVFETFRDSENKLRMRKITVSKAI